MIDNSYYVYIYIIKNLKLNGNKKLELSAEYVLKFILCA